MINQDLLFELGCEELPPKRLKKLSQTLCENISAGLREANLNYESAEDYCTPRRLAVKISGLRASQPDKVIERRGPSIDAAFLENGLPSKAAVGFAKSCHTTVEKLDRLKNNKGEWLAFRQNVRGVKTELLIPEIIKSSIQNLPIAKKMRWGEGEIEFARPVHWMVLLFGGQIIHTEILGIATGNATRGHRFHAPQKIIINSPESYVDVLFQQGKVIVDYNQRKNRILEAANKSAAEVSGVAHIDNDLLDEITAINEWPVAVLGNFEQKFLELPMEVLITSMQSNQKYFPVKNQEDKLMPHFITFSNIASSNPESVRLGNERVIKPRLADAEFFWNQDRKRKLEERVDDLKKIVFQEKLGTLEDKTNRVVFLAEHIAGQLSENVEIASRAARLAKTDLLTEMVGEFAGLQGTIGRYYALADNEPEAVAIALEEQYYPKQSGSSIASSAIGRILALSEKIDTLCGIFSVGMIPTGDKDPYALRRSALGILRTMIEGKLNLDMNDLVDIALAQFKHEFDKSATRNQLIHFIRDRLKGYCLDQGYRIDEFEAVNAISPVCPLDFMLRLKAVKAFRRLPEATSLAAANKRIINILKKTKDTISGEIGPLVERQEIKLLNEANESEKEIQSMLNNKDYQSALARLAKLKETVDEFFDHVMVNVDDLSLRHSRLALLSKLSNQFFKIADISKLQA